MQAALLMIALGSVAYFWWSSAGVHERVMHTAKLACQKADMQLLDATVALRKLRLQRDEQGRLRLARLYEFEFSHNGLDRHEGYIVTLAERIYQVHLYLPDDHPLADQTPTQH
ncbi:MAG TPA: DUF3301 domain-containing protein [Gammaproteobacteria bacterium]|jgi:hypothetical protein|nr:DUF3301 domain-containing protein [Gammaproteobacteria bacterium]